MSIPSAAESASTAYDASISASIASISAATSAAAAAQAAATTQAIAYTSLTSAEAQAAAAEAAIYAAEAAVAAATAQVAATNAAAAAAAAAASITDVEAAAAAASATTAANAATAAETTAVNANIAAQFLLSNICFPAGTPISTNMGQIAIDQLDPSIHLIRNKKIVAITQTISPDKYLVCIEKDAIGMNVPSQKTIISKNHQIMYNGKMTAAKEFVNSHANVSKIAYNGEILYNVLMDEHDKMMVNNLICETLHPKSTVAQVYRILPKLNPEQRLEFIRSINKEIVEKHIYTNKVRRI